MRKRRKLANTDIMDLDTVPHHNIVKGTTALRNHLLNEKDPAWPIELDDDSFLLLDEEVQELEVEKHANAS